MLKMNREKIPNLCKNKSTAKVVSKLDQDNRKLANAVNELLNLPQYVTILLSQLSCSARPHFHL